MNHRLAYAIGFHPWEDAATDPPFVAKAAQMLDREERDRQPPYGRALDLATGSGIWIHRHKCREWLGCGAFWVSRADDRRGLDWDDGLRLAEHARQ